MANTDRAYGFRPYQRLSRLSPYSKLASYGTAALVNDMISAVASGNVEVATAGDIVLIGSNQTFSAASTAATLMVADDVRGQQFQAQSDDGGATAITRTEVHNAMNHLATPGSTVTKLSGHELDKSNTGTATGGFVIQNIVIRADNAAGDFADLVCEINTGEAILTLAAGI